MARRSRDQFQSSQASTLSRNIATRRAADSDRQASPYCAGLQDTEHRPRHRSLVKLRPIGAQRVSGAPSVRPAEVDAFCTTNPWLQRIATQIATHRRHYIDLYRFFALALSLRNGFTAYFVLSPVSGLCCHRRRAEKTSRKA
jgi:hypothetical protein